MQSVTVLTPHGRRHVVKVEPNKTILWLLEQVCLKFNFDPDCYALKRQNKLLDCSLMIRFAGLPNNTNLEMVETEKKRVEVDLVICVQLEDGTRVNGNFGASSTLREVITKLCPEKAAEDQSPVVVYMRSEFFGDSLEATTLKSLGLSSGGRALLRLINTDPESLKVQANVSAPLPQKPKEESLVDYKPRARSNVAEAGPSGVLQVNDVKRLKQELNLPDDAAPEMMSIDNQEVAEAVSEPMEEVTESPAAAELEPTINILDDRGTIIFSLDSLKTPSMDLPDSFFDLTEADVRKLYRDMKTQCDEIENRPLMTAALRKLEENKLILNQLSLYKTCAIRLQLPNRLVIQTKFSTVHTVGIVKDFVRQFLVDPNMEFHLYLTPPKTILADGATLVESNCVPSALLHFGCDAWDDNQLKAEFYEKLSSGPGVSRVLVSERTQEQPAAGPSRVNVTRPVIPSNFMPSKASSSESTGAIPKWFKPRK